MRESLLNEPKVADRNKLLLFVGANLFRHRGVVTFIA